MNEQQVREHVQKLRRFYTDVLIYGIVNVGLIFIWLLSGAGYFWPIWVIVGWGIGLGIHAFSLGLIPQMNAMVPFMNNEWEDKEVKRLMEGGYKGKGKKKVKISIVEEGEEISISKDAPKKAPAPKKKKTTKSKKPTSKAKK